MFSSYIGTFIYRLKQGGISLFWWWWDPQSDWRRKYLCDIGAGLLPDYFGASLFDKNEPNTYNGHYWVLSVLMSNIDKIQKINSLVFSTARLSVLLGISKNAANKLGSRYVKNN